MFYIWFILIKTCIYLTVHIITAIMNVCVMYIGCYVIGFK